MIMRSPALSLFPAEISCGLFTAGEEHDLNPDKDNPPPPPPCGTLVTCCWAEDDLSPDKDRPLPPRENLTCFSWSCLPKAVTGLGRGSTHFSLTLSSFVTISIHDLF
jgi:hypothetical protein